MNNEIWEQERPDCRANLNKGQKAPRAALRERKYDGNRANRPAAN